MAFGSVRGLVFALPFLAALLVALPAVNGRLLWDDRVLIADDRFIHELSNAPALFTRSFWAQATPSTTSFDYYRPLTTLSYMLTWAVAGAAPPPYHAFNMLLYAATAGLLGLLLLELGAGAGIALAAGLLFAVFPMHHENVDFISGRTDLLAGLWLLLAAFARNRLRESRVSLPMLALCAAGAAFSKETAVLAPACLLLWEWAERWPRGAAARIAVVSLPILAMLALRQVALASRVHAGIPTSQVVLTGLLLNTRNLLLPWPLHVNQYLPQNLAHAPLRAVAAWAAFVVLGFLLAGGRGSRAAWICTWLLVIPASLTGVPADRMIYLPSMIFIPWVAWRLSRIPLTPAAKIAACAVLVLACGIAFARQGRVWRDDRAFFEAQVAESPWDAGARAHLAETYQRAGSEPGLADTTRQRWQGLIEHHLRIGTRLDHRKPQAWFILGRTYFEQGRDALALQAIHSGLGLGEDDQARALEAQTLLRMGRWPEAESAAVRSLATDAGRRDPDRWATLGWIQFQEYRYAESVRSSEAALRLDPGLLYAAYNRALALGAAGKLEQSRDAYAETLRNDTDGNGAAAAIEDLVGFDARNGANAHRTISSFVDALSSREDLIKKLEPALRRLRSGTSRGSAAPSAGRAGG